MACVENEAIAALELFRDVPPEAMTAVIEAARIRALPRGARVFDQGESIDRARALLSGAVRIAQTGSDGDQVVLRFIGAGEIFGSVAIYTDRHYPADAVAMADSVEASWDRAVLTALMERHSRIAINMVSIIGRRLAELQERVRELATQSAERRIANALLRLARRAGQPAAGGVEIGFPLRRKDIADISGTTLHTVSRVLTRWGLEGLVLTEHRHLTLCSIAEIERIAAG